MAETRPYDSTDALREALVELFLEEVSKQHGPETARSYRADVEHLDHALLSFAERYNEIMQMDIPPLDEGPLAKYWHRAQANNGMIEES
jgi:hypothetical protein